MHLDFYIPGPGIVQICPDIREERVKNTSGHLRAIQVVPVAPAPPEGCGCNMQIWDDKGLPGLGDVPSWIVSFPIEKGCEYLWMVVTCEFLPKRLNFCMERGCLLGKYVDGICLRTVPRDATAPRPSVATDNWDDNLVTETLRGCKAMRIMRCYHQSIINLSSIYQLPGYQPVFIKAFHRSWLDTDVRKVKGARWRKGLRIAEAAGFQVHSKSCNMFS